LGYFAIYALAGLLFVWAMAIYWSVSAGPSSIGTIILMLIASVVAASSGVWLFNKRAAAMLHMALLAFFILWPPITYVVHGLSIGVAIFYVTVLVLFFIATRAALRPNAVPQSVALTQKRLIAYTALSLIPLALAVVLSFGLWAMIFSFEFWQNVSSHPDIWGLRSR
jgi:hypothetical protein